MEKIEEILTNMKLDNNNLYDLLYNLRFQLELIKSEEDVRNENVMTVEESKERMKRKHANFNVG